MNPRRRGKKAEQSVDSKTAQRAGNGAAATASAPPAAQDEVVDQEAPASAETLGQAEPRPETPDTTDTPDALDARQESRLQNAEFERAREEWRAREDGLLRTLAERENQIRRLWRDQEQAAWRDRADLVAPLLDVLDDFDRALAHAGEAAESEFGAGIALIAQRLLEALEKLGLEAIVARGEKFDPVYHEALMTVASDEVDKGHVVDEIQRGYRLGDRVLRPSKVSVAG